MTRTEFLAFAATATTVHPRGGVRAEVTIRRDDDALLSPFTVAIALHNGSGHLLTLDFPTPDLYRIDVRRDDTVVWSSATGHQAPAIARKLNVPAGTMRLVNQTIDTLTDDHRAYAPGAYTLRVTFLGATLNASIDKPIAFAAPIPIASATRERPGKVVTIAGIVRETGIPQLEDASGAIRLSHALGLHPSGPYVVRGYIETQGGENVFAIVRYAPASEGSP